MCTAVVVVVGVAGGRHGAEGVWLHLPLQEGAGRGCFDASEGSALNKL